MPAPKQSPEKTQKGLLQRFAIFLGGLGKTKLRKVFGGIAAIIAIAAAIYSTLQILNFNVLLMLVVVVALGVLVLLSLALIFVEDKKTWPRYAAVFTIFLITGGCVAWTFLVLPGKAMGTLGITPFDFESNTQQKAPFVRRTPGKSEPGGDERLLVDNGVARRGTSIQVVGVDVNQYDWKDPNLKYEYSGIEITPDQPITNMIGIEAWVYFSPRDKEGEPTSSDATLRGHIQVRLAQRKGLCSLDRDDSEGPDKQYMLDSELIAYSEVAHEGWTRLYIDDINTAFVQAGAFPQWGWFLCAKNEVAAIGISVYSSSKAWSGNLWFDDIIVYSIHP